MKKPTCSDCTHADKDSMAVGDVYCRKHRTFYSPTSGCDDYWPAERNPRCDECRLWVEKPYSDFPEGRCHHSAIGTITADWYCENWRAR